MISLMDVIDANQPISPIVDEVKSMKTELKAKMDTGLSVEDMKIAKAQMEAIIIAENILENILNK